MIIIAHIYQHCNNFINAGLTVQSQEGEELKGVLVCPADIGKNSLCSALDI